MSIEIGSVALLTGADGGRVFQIGDWVHKRSGSYWEGKIVGFYSTAQTPEGYCIQLLGMENGPVQIYPRSALEAGKYVSGHPYEDWNNMYKFVMEHCTDDTYAFMRIWGEGDWTTLDKEWPEWKAFINALDSTKD